MVKRAKAKTPKTRKAKAKKKVVQKRVRKTSPGIAKRISNAVDIVAGAMLDAQRMRKKAVKKAPMDEG